MSFGKIKITNFGKRHFDPKFGGTKITSHTPEQIEVRINGCLVKKLITAEIYLTDIGCGHSPSPTDNQKQESTQREYPEHTEGSPFRQMYLRKM